MAESIEVVQALAAADAENSTAIDEFESLLQQRAEIARAVLAAHRAEDHELVTKLLADEAAMVEIVRLAHRIRARNVELLTQRDQSSFSHDQTARSTLYIGSGLNLLILLSIAWFIRDDLRARRLAAKTLLETNTLLEARVKELTAANQ